MSQFYIGVKQVFAFPEDRDGRAGYHVVYDQGAPREYHSWSPKEVFEAAYLPMGEGADESKISEEMVRGFVWSEEADTLVEKTTILHVITANGFELTESSSCVDSANYEEELGVRICRERVRGQIWHLLGFVLQWARHGLK